MSGRAKRLWILLALLGLGTGLALDPGRSANETATREGAPPGALSPEAERAPGEDPAPGLSALGAGPEAPPGKDKGLGADGPKTTPPAARHILRGRLLGLDASLPGRAAVIVTPLDTTYRKARAQPSGTAARDGTFEVDVSAVFAADRTIVELLVEVDHPAYLPVQTKVPLPIDAARAQGTQIYAVEVELRRAGIITGRIHDEAGTALPGSEVAAFPLSDGQPDGTRRFTGAVRMDGTYRIRIALRAEYVIVAAAPGRRPSLERVALGAGNAVELPPLILHPGVHIAGQISFREVGLPGAEIECRAAAAEGAVSLGLRSATVRWQQGQVSLERVLARADPAGHFVLEGLSRGAHRVRLAHAPTLSVHMAVREATEQEVEAPAEHVRIDVRGVRLVVEVRAAEALTGAVSVMVMGAEGTVSLTADKDGRVTLLMSPESAFSVRVWAEGFETGELRSMTPVVGTDQREVIELKRPRAKPKLIITLVSPDGKKIEAAGFGLFPAEKGAAFPLDHWDVKARKGRFVLGSLASGRYRLAVRAGGPWYGGQSHYVQTEVEVSVPAAGERRVSVALQVGGRLRIEATTPDGTSVPADCVLRDARGEVLDVHFTTRSPQGMSSGTGALDGGGISTVDPALAAGRYEVRLAFDGFLPETRTIDLGKGQTQDVRLRLRPVR